MNTTFADTMPTLAGAAALLCLLLSCAQALAADDPAQKQVTASGAVDTIKKAIHSQGDITPEAKAALSKTEEGRKALEAADQRQKPAAAAAKPAQGSAAHPGGTGRKALYGDIIIHK
jgi:hypothetical protein